MNINALEDFRISLANKKENDTAQKVAIVKSFLSNLSKRNIQVKYDEENLFELLSESTLNEIEKDENAIFNKLSCRLIDGKISFIDLFFMIDALSISSIAFEGMNADRSRTEWILLEGSDLFVNDDAVYFPIYIDDNVSDLDKIEHEKGFLFSIVNGLRYLTFVEPQLYQPLAEKLKIIESSLKAPIGERMYYALELNYWLSKKLGSDFNQPNVVERLALGALGIDFQKCKNIQSTIDEGKIDVHACVPLDDKYFKQKEELEYLYPGLLISLESNYSEINLILDMEKFVKYSLLLKNKKNDDKAASLKKDRLFNRFFEKPSKSIPDYSIVTSAAIARAFSIDAKAIINLDRKDKELNIDCSDLKSAKMLHDTIRVKLEAENGCQYGDLISDLCREEKPVIQLSFNALDDLIKLLNRKESSSAPPLDKKPMSIDFPKNKSTSMPLPVVTSEGIADTFSIGIDLITDLRFSLDIYLEIHLVDLKVAKMLHDTIRVKLEAENGCQYGDLISDLCREEKPVIQLSFNALDDLIKLLNRKESSSAPPLDKKSMSIPFPEKKSTSMPLPVVTSEGIANTFSIGIDLITDLRFSLDIYLEIHLVNLKVAKMLHDTIRAKLEAENGRQYPGFIRDLFHEKKPVIQLSFYALNDLIKLLNRKESSSFSPLPLDKKPMSIDFPKKKSTSMPLPVVTSEGIANTFSIGIDLITDLRFSLDIYLEIYLVNLKVAKMLHDTIRAKLEAENGRQYPGFIRDLFDEKKPVIQLSFDALDDLIKLLNSNQKNNKATLSFK